MIGRVERAMELAAVAHLNQFDDNGEPHVMHVMRVAVRMRTDAEIQVALLHDVFDDAETTVKTLYDHMFTTEVIEAVAALRQHEGEAFVDYVVRLAGNELARRVKLVELFDFLRPANVAFLRNDLARRYQDAARFLVRVGQEAAQ